MRKIIYTLILCLSALLIVSCGGYETESSTYKLEKLHAQAASLEDTRLGIKPELATNDDFQAVIAAYRNVVDKYLELFPDLSKKEKLSDQDKIATGLGGLSLLRMAELNIISGDTAAAMEDYEKVEVYFPHNGPHQRIAWLNLAKIYDQEQQFDKVEVIYNKLLARFYPPADEKFTALMDIISLPVQLIRFYKMSDNPDKVQQYTEYALDYYQRIKDSYLGTNLAITATRFLAETYKSAGEPKTAIDIFKTVTDSTGEISTPALLLMAETYYENLQDYDNALKYYEMILDRGTDSLYTPKVLMGIGTMCLKEKKYDRARQAFRELLDKHEYARKDHPRALSLIAQSYEEQKNYEQAQNAYVALVEEFPTHSLTYQTYTYLPEFFRKQGKKQLQEQWYNRAESFFLDNARKYKQENIGAASQEYLSQLYMRYEKWDLAVKALRKLAEDYSDYVFATEAYARMAAIFEEKLDMPDSAQVYYKKQVETYPNHVVSKAVQKKIIN